MAQQQAIAACATARHRPRPVRQRSSAARHRRRPVPPPPARQSHGWIYGPGGAAWAISCPIAAGSWPALATRHRPVLGLIVFLGGIALAVALCAYPVVRRLTRRLERLQQGVEQLGSGNLSARVKVEGRDEVARLAASFNRAAGRIEELVGAHQMLLANTSHELRTPLSRIRLGIELMLENVYGRGKTELLRDIAELDRLIDEILLSSRLDAQAVNRADEEIDLLALAAEEGARYDDCTLEGSRYGLRRPRPVAAHAAQPARQCRALWQSADRDQRRPPGRPGIDRRVRSGSGCAGERARADLLALLSRRLRLEESGRGTGFGLTLVHQIAGNHGGTARWAPGRDKPSRIEVTLLLAENRVTSRKD